jgi:transposase
MSRHHLTDEQWELIEPLFPPRAKTGRPPRDHRQVLNGILWILNAGAAWRDLPEEFGPWATIWDRFDTWNASGLFAKILNCLRAAQYDCDEIDKNLWCVDGTSIRAARCAAGGGKKGTPRNRRITH